METLPIEIVTHLLSFLDNPDLVPVRFVCRLWRDIVGNINIIGKSYAQHAPNMTLLRWAKRNGCPITKDTLSEYAAQGRIEFIEYAFKLGVDSFDFGDMAVAAAKNGRIDTMEWISNTIDVSRKDYSDMALLQDTNMIKNAEQLFGFKLYDDSDQLNEVIEKAVEGDNIDLLSNLPDLEDDDLYNYMTDLLDIAIKNCSLKAIWWLTVQYNLNDFWVPRTHIEQMLEKFSVEELKHAWMGVGQSNIRRDDISDSMLVSLNQSDVNKLKWLVTIFPALQLNPIVIKLNIL